MNERAFRDAATPAIEAAAEMIRIGTSPRPALWPITNGRKRGVVVAPADRPDDVGRWLALMGTFAVAFRADALLFLTDGFVRPLGADETLDVRPREDPQAHEAILTFYADVDGEISADVEYHRGDRGEITFVDPKVRQDPVGRIVETLRAILEVDPVAIGVADLEPSVVAFALSLQGYEVAIYEGEDG